MYKRIVVAVDGSKHSDLALNHAIKLAKDQRAALRLLHVVDETPAYTTMGEIPYAVDDYRQSMRAGGRKVLAAAAARAKAGRVKSDTKLTVIAGLSTRVWEAVNKEAQRWRADLIVIGTHGRRGFDRFMLGSVAEGVIRRAGAPVLVIHAR
jgi:nucleotide-binding universal stress UspA family protein